jgi:hypothetical protein
MDLYGHLTEAKLSRHLLVQMSTEKRQGILVVGFQYKADVTTRPAQVRSYLESGHTFVDQ